MSGITEIAKELAGMMPADVAFDLAFEDPTAAIELHFAPLIVRALPPATFAVGERCSCDGYYESLLDPTRPVIVHADDVDPARSRFTLMHELGHHLSATIGASLLDDIDRVAGRRGDPARVEELVCHEFAGRVLISDEIIEGLGARPLVPQHAIDLRTVTNASWEAIAVRLVGTVRGACAVVLTREPGTLGFCAVSGALGDRGWPRGSRLDPGGPLARAHRNNSTAQPETYRWEMAYARRLFCDTAQVHAKLAVGVLSERPSDGHFELLEQPDPAWKEREEFCLWCGNERDRGWCRRCRGRYCNDCGRCGCQTPRDNPVCSACGLKKPFRKGARVCLDCEGDS